MNDNLNEHLNLNPIDSKNPGLKILKYFFFQRNGVSRIFSGLFEQFDSVLRLIYLIKMAINISIKANHFNIQ